VTTSTAQDALVDGLPCEYDADAPVSDMVDEWGLQSFPASDPPANW
jgi:hypothetical protein